MPMRVHALATALGITHHELLHVIEGAPRDIPADSMMSQLTDDDVDYLRHGIAHGFDAKRSPPPSPAPNTEAHYDELRAKRARRARSRASKPVESARDKLFRANMQAYQDLFARWRSAPVLEPEPATQLSAQLDVSYTDPGPLGRGILRRRDDAVALLHPYQALVRDYLVGAHPITVGPPLLESLRHPDPATLRTLRTNIELLYRRFEIDWDYYDDYVSAGARGARSGSCQMTWGSFEHNLRMRDSLNTYLGEHTYEYDDDARFARWRQDPSTIDPDWAVRELATSIALDTCLAHEIERAEDVLLDILRRHILGGAEDGPLTSITLFEEDENTRYQFGVLAGAGGAAIWAWCWVL